MQEEEPLFGNPKKPREDATEYHSVQEKPQPSSAASGNMASNSLALILLATFILFFSAGGWMLYNLSLQSDEQAAQLAEQAKIIDELMELTAVQGNEASKKQTSLSSRISRLETGNKAVQKNLANLNESMRVRRKERDQNKTNFAQLKQAVSDEEKQRKASADKASTEIQQIQAAQEGMQASNQELTKALEDMKTLFPVFSKQLAALKEQKAKASRANRQELDLLQQQLNQVRKTIESLSTKIKQIENTQSLAPVTP